MQTPPLQLAIWRVSGDASKPVVFRQKLQSSSRQAGALVPTLCTSPPGQNGFAGAVGNTLIPFQGVLTPLVNYLAQLFGEGLQYRTLNTVRSAISMTHEEVDGVPLGRHPAVSRLMRGIYNSRPPTPRYTVTWKVGSVTAHLKSWGPNGSLSLKNLSLKLAMLMALVEASRSSELAALDLRYRTFKPEGVVFKLPTLTKKRNPGAPPRELFFGAFPEDKDLCVVQCLRCYELATRDLRSQGTALFVSYVKSHKPVSSQRIAHWLKTTLALSGIDTATFSAHSTRGEATSAAKDKGLPMSDILEAADWSGENTFKRFYYRPTKSASFAQTVLSAD